MELRLEKQFNDSSSVEYSRETLFKADVAVNLWNEVYNQTSHNWNPMTKIAAALLASCGQKSSSQSETANFIYSSVRRTTPVVQATGSPAPRLGPTSIGSSRLGWLDGELVHRSVHVHLKKAPAFIGAETASIG